MYVTDSNYAVSSWMHRTIASRDAALSSVTDLDRAGRAIVDTRIDLSGLVNAIRQFLGVHKKRRSPLADLFDRDLTDLGLVRLQLGDADDRIDDARWTAYDPRLPKVANSNRRNRSRVA